MVVRMNEADRAVKAVYSVWQIVVALSAQGLISHDMQSRISRALQVWSVYVRTNKNKTHTAATLGKSRRWVRDSVKLIELEESDFPRTIRRALVGSPEERPTAEEIASELVACLPRALKGVVQSALDTAAIEATADPDPA